MSVNGVNGVNGRAILTKEEIFLRLRDMMLQTLNFPPEAIHLKADMYADLQFDSLDFMDTLIAVEKILGRCVKDEILMDARTVGDAIDVIYAMQFPAAVVTVPPLIESTTQH